MMPPAMVTVRYLNLTAHKIPENFARYLSDAEIQKAASARESRRHAFLAGRYLVRKTLRDVYHLRAQDIEILCEESGKPYARVADKKIAVSISHNHNFAVCAVSDQCELGIDLEAKTRRPINRKSWPLVFNDQEQAVLTELGETRSRSLSMLWWCLKEAAFKISGQGGLRQLDCSAIQTIPVRAIIIGGHWQLECLADLPSHYVTLCTNPHSK